MLRDEYRIKRVTKVIRQHHRGTSRASSKASNAEAFIDEIKQLQRGGDDRTSQFNPEREGRPRHDGARYQQVELGQHNR